MNEATKGNGPEPLLSGMELENFGDPGQAALGGESGGGGNSNLVSSDQAALSSAENAANLDTILGISVTLSVELGRARMNISELLHLAHGSVVDLNRFAGSPMDILANGTLIAHGEVVVVNDRFGVRLTDVVSPAERIKGLK